MWLGLLWVVTMLLCVFHAISGAGGKDLRVLMGLLYGISLIWTYFSKKRIAYVWFGVISSLCVIYISIRALI